MRVRDPRSATAGTLGLLVATALWGVSFTWNKAAVEGIHEATGRSTGDMLGPLLLLGIRFTFAAVLWLLVRPDSLGGWSARSLRRGVVLGLALFVPMLLQMLGLDRTSEAVNAFLTSLTVVFVPLAVTFVLREPPLRPMWIAVAIAALGVWLLTGAAPTGFGLGEILGLGCGIVFSAHIIAIDRIMPVERLSRMTFAQFALAGVLSLALVPAAGGGLEALSPRGLSTILSHGAGSIALSPAGIFGSRSVALNIALVATLSTLGAFTLQFAFQPRISPTRAALVLLAEPLFAALFAFWLVGRTLAPVAIAGALLIVGANVVAEIVSRRRRVRAPASATA